MIFELTRNTNPHLNRKVKTTRSVVLGPLLALFALSVAPSVGYSKGDVEDAFLGMLKDMNAYVQKLYPKGAELYKADYDAQRRNLWQTVFNYRPCPDKKNNSIIVVELTPRGIFTLPKQICEQQQTEGQVITVPSLKVGLKDALDLAAGCVVKPFKRINLRFSPAPAKEPYYILTTRNKQALVGAYSKQMRCETSGH
jgi:hypothetical protein